jgi:hypothetical protein
MCFVFILQQTATFAVYNINCFFFYREEKCLLCGTNCVFKWNSLRFVFKALHHLLSHQTTNISSSSDHMFMRQCTSSVWTASYLRSHFAFDLSYGHRVASSVLRYRRLHAAVIAVITCNTRVSTKTANDQYQHASSARKRNSGNWGGDNLARACDSKSAISIS